MGVLLALLCPKSGLQTLEDTLDFSIKVDFNAGVVAAGRAQIESTVTGNSSKFQTDDTAKSLVDQSQVGGRDAACRASAEGERAAVLCGVLCCAIAATVCRICRILHPPPHSLLNTKPPLTPPPRWAAGLSPDQQRAVRGGPRSLLPRADRAGTATLTSFWTMPPFLRGNQHAPCDQTTLWPCLSDADWRLQSDVMTDLVLPCMLGTPHDRFACSGDPASGEPGR